MNYNPFVDSILKMYSQSLISTGMTRGLDEETYIPTRLDKALKTDVLQGKKKLVVLTGNAGDGKTAFIQLIESSAKCEGAKFTLESDNGCRFSHNGFDFETLYDGSQDFDGKKNDDLLKVFFLPFEGSAEPKAKVVKIIAINEGKLRDFILNKREYNWLGKQVHHYLEWNNHKLPDSLSFINLNNRSVVELSSDDSIIDALLDIILDSKNEKKFWEPCSSVNCEYSDKCYIKSTIDKFNDKDLGPVLRNRLKECVLAAYLKKVKHITMRDIRSLISFILLNKYSCNQIQSDIDNGENLLDRFYYNNAFNFQEQDRLVSIFSEIDVSAMPLPKIDNHLYFLNPKSESAEMLFIKRNPSVDIDVPFLSEYFDNKPEGTSDTDEIRKRNAEVYLVSMKRKLFFECNDDYIYEQFVIDHYSFLPYKYFETFITFLNTGVDRANTIRDDLVLAISKSEKIYNDSVGRGHVCISSNNSRKTQTKAFYVFKAADFEIALPDVGGQKSYIEYFPDHIIFRHVDKTMAASLEINIDLFEILMRIKEGYVPTSIEIQTFFLNLEMFKRRVLSKRSTKVLLTEDDSNLYVFEKSETGKLVLSIV